MTADEIETVLRTGMCLAHKIAAEGCATCERKLAAIAEVRAMVEVVEAARRIEECWPEGGCLVDPPCGACRWCRFVSALAKVQR